MRALVRSPNRLVAVALAVAFFGYGALAVSTDRPLLGVVFVGAAAVLGVAGVLGIAWARGANIGVGAAWVVLGYAGLFLIGTPLNVVGLTPYDEVALFAAATVHLAVGLGARRDVAALT